MIKKASLPGIKFEGHFFCLKKRGGAYNEKGVFGNTLVEILSSRVVADASLGGCTAASPLSRKPPRKFVRGGKGGRCWVVTRC